MLDLDTLDLKRLRAFHLVARMGNLRLAAARLGQSIPAISGKLRKLETDLGFDLFERLPNRLVLTPAGERFLNEVDGIFERAEQALTSLSRATPEGRLSISVGSDHAWYFAPRIRNFLNRYPAIEVNLCVYKSAEALLAIDKGKVDLALGIFPDPPKRLERHTIIETGLSLAYNPQDPNLRRRPPTLGDLTRQRLIVPPGTTTTRRLIERHLGASLAKASMILEAPTCETAATFVETGVGSAIVHTLCLERLRSRHVQGIDLGPRVGKVGFAVVYRKSALRQPACSALLEQLTDQAS